MIQKLGRTAWRALDRFLSHHGPDRAAAVAYYTLLSLLPLLIFVISVGVAIYGSFDAAYQGTLVLFGGLVVHLDQASLDTMRAFVERSVRFRWPGILLLVWTSSLPSKPRSRSPPAGSLAAISCPSRWSSSRA